MLRVARGMRRLGIEFEEVIDSGFVRARQTSECICKAYEIDPSAIRTLDELAPEAEPEATLAALKKLRVAVNVALVGHEPHLSKLAGYLVCGGADGQMDFKKAGVCRVDLARWAEGEGILAALLPPKALRRLGK